MITFSSFGLVDSTDPADLLAAPGLGFTGVILSEDIANVVVRALKTDGQSKVISTPKLLINDNTNGSLSSTLNIPFESINNIDGVTFYLLDQLPLSALTTGATVIAAFLTSALDGRTS